MNRCRTCKHWTRGNDKKRPSMGSCQSEKWQYGKRELPDGVWFEDYEGYAAGFETGEDFGCIHHSEGEGRNEAEGPTERVAATLNAEHGNALVGMFWVGESQRLFSLALRNPVTEASIVAAFAKIGDELAHDWYMEWGKRPSPAGHDGMTAP